MASQMEGMPHALALGLHAFSAERVSDSDLLQTSPAWTSRPLPSSSLPALAAQQPPRSRLETPDESRGGDPGRCHDSDRIDQCGHDTTTDSSRHYSFDGLANGRYTLTPSLSGHTFHPPSASATVTSTNIAGLDFAATAVAEPVCLSSLKAVWGSGRNDIWAVGGAGAMLHWNGTAWSNVASRTTSTLLSVTSDGRAKRLICPWCSASSPRRTR
jgi:hypothetical protein